MDYNSIIQINFTNLFPKVRGIVMHTYNRNIYSDRHLTRCFFLRGQQNNILTLLWKNRFKKINCTIDDLLIWHDMKDHEGALRFAEIMNRTADKLRPHGLRLGYHNHDHDMAVDRGEVLLDTLLANTEEDIFMEFDVFWVEYAGFSPLRYISRYAGRQPLMHLKELGADRKSNVEIGAGISDFAAFIRLGREIGTEQFIVEQEEYTMPPLESCRKSLESLLKL